LAVVAVGATADVAVASNVEPIESATSLLVLPEEMTGGQFTAQQIAAQQTAIDSLSPAAAAAQDALRTEQAQYSAGAAEHYINVASLTKPSMTPMIVGRDCSTSSAWYRLSFRADGSNLTYCVAGAGVWYMSTYLDGVKSLRAGSQRGRVMYRSGVEGGLYWSTWRGENDWTEYYFDEIYGTIRVYRIEISQGPF